jgi:hypothetical protein
MCGREGLISIRPSNRLPQMRKRLSQAGAMVAGVGQLVGEDALRAGGRQRVPLQIEILISVEPGHIRSASRPHRDCFAKR